ncbi:MAG: glutaredoxin 3 [Methyloligellaceae bacterium]
MSNVVIYTKDYCGFCAQAKAFLEAKGATFTEIDVTHDTTLQTEMMDRSKRRTVPQIFIDGRHIGGFDDLAALDRRGELDTLFNVNEDESCRSISSREMAWSSADRP